jgi:hypothetical protein
VLALIALAFIAPGLAGHDLWKTFDAIGIEIAHQMHLSGDWVVPRVAGEPWLEDAPLYHWVALAFGKLLGWAIPFHNAARLASGLCLALALWFLYRVVGAAGPLLLMGSIGLFMHAHEAVTDLAALAATCAAYAVLPRAHERPLAKGALFGAALGLAALGGSWIAPASLAAAVFIAHAACAPWRNAKALPFLAAAAVAAALVAGSWPYLLSQRAPDLLGVWWSLATHTRGEFYANLRYFAVTASWFAWPAWPLAAWALWALRRHWYEPRLFGPRWRPLTSPASRCRAGAGHHPHRAAHTARAAGRRGRGAAAPRRRRRPRLVQRHDLHVFCRAHLAGLRGIAHRRAAKDPVQLPQERARFRGAVRPGGLRARRRADAGLALCRFFHRTLADARRDALGGRRGHAVGLLRRAADAPGRLPEELPQRRAAVALQGSGGRGLHRRAEPGRNAARGAQLSRGPAHGAGGGSGASRRLPPAAGAGPPAGRARRPGRHLDQDRRRRPAGDKHERYRLYRRGAR